MLYFFKNYQPRAYIINLLLFLCFELQTYQLLERLLIEHNCFETILAFVQLSVEALIEANAFIFSNLLFLAGWALFIQRVAFIVLVFRVYAICVMELFFPISLLTSFLICFLLYLFFIICSNCFFVIISFYRLLIFCLQDRHRKKACQRSSCLLILHEIQKRLLHWDS